MAKLGATSKMIYLSPIGGKFAQRVNEDTPGATKRVTKNGKTMYELYHNSVSGVITKMEIREGNFDSTCFTLDDEIQVQLSGRISYNNANIVNSLLSSDCDIAKEVTFCIASDGEFYKVFIMQNGKGLKWFSTKANPNGAPQPTKKEVSGKTEWDYDDRDNFFYGKFLELAEKVKSNQPNKELPDSVFIQKEETEDESSPEESNMIEDELPEIPKVEHKPSIDVDNLPF